jgi:hypothetical protein
MGQIDGFHDLPILIENTDHVLLGPPDHLDSPFPELPPHIATRHNVQKLRCSRKSLNANNFQPPNILAEPTSNGLRRIQCKANEPVTSFWRAIMLDPPEGLWGGMDRFCSSLVVHLDYSP